MEERTTKITKQWAIDFANLLTEDERGILATQLMFVGKEDDRIDIHTILLVGTNQQGVEKVAAIDVATNKAVALELVQY